MRALAVHNREIQLLEDAPEPACGADEVVIRPLLAGICNTDLELVHGYYNYEGILGHEFVGQVVDGPGEWIGRRVVGEINIVCGECDLCREGAYTHCRNRSTLGIQNHAGVFADRFTLPVRNLHPVPDSLKDEQAVFVEPLAAACQVLDAVHVRPSDRVVVLGAGKLGLLVAQVLRLIGADLAVVVRHERQARLLAQWGVEAARLADLPERQAHTVVDCTGRAEGFADALRLLRPRGTLVLKSTYHGLPQADLTQVAVNEVTVTGSRCGPFDVALRLLANGLVDVESLIEARYSLPAGAEALAAAAEPGRLKVLLTFDGAA